MTRALALFAALASGCGSHPTEAILTLSNADLVVPADFDTVHLEVHQVNASGALLSSADVKPCAPGEHGDGCKPFPFTVLFVPGDQPDTRAWVSVRALLAGNQVINDAFVLAFVRGLTLRYDLVLYRICKQSHCADQGEVCNAQGACAPLDAMNAPDLAAPGDDLGGVELGSDAAATDGPVPPRRVFLTSGTWFGNFGGRGGADTHCAQEASGAGLTGKFVAILGDTTSSPKQYLVLDGGARPIVLTNGKPIATDNTFWEATHLNYINVNASGQQIGRANNISDFPWTGFDYTGATPSTDTCGNWTGTTLTAYFGDSWGDSPTIVGGWAHYAVQGNCLSNFPCRLYCIEQ